MNCLPSAFRLISRARIEPVHYVVAGIGYVIDEETVDIDYVSPSARMKTPSKGPKKVEFSKWLNPTR